MKEIFVQAPVIQVDIGEKIIENRAAVSVVPGVSYENLGINADYTEMLVRIFKTDDAKQAEIKKLANVTELTKTQLNSKKATFLR